MFCYHDDGGAVEISEARMKKFVNNCEKCEYRKVYFYGHIMTKKNKKLFNILEAIQKFSFSLFGKQKLIDANRPD